MEPEPILNDHPDITHLFGKGAVITHEDVTRDQYALSAPVPVFIDWTIPFRVPANLTQKNQASSSSCTAQATNYYCEALNQIDHGVSELYSSRWIYSQTSIGPNQGAYIWKAMSIPLLKGAADLNSVPEGDSSESTMRDTLFNAHAVLEAKTDKYAVISRQQQGIDFMAQIVRDYHGFVTGFNGWNGMFDKDGTVIDWSKNEWGHAVYVCGYEMRKGQKCLVFKNSWSSQWGDGGYGYFPEAFVTSGMLFDAYVYATIQDLENKMKLVKIDGSNEVYVVNNGVRTHIYNQAALKAFSDFESVEVITQADFDAIPDSGVDLAALVKE